MPGRLAASSRGGRRPRGRSVTDGRSSTSQGASVAWATAVGTCLCGVVPLLLTQATTHARADPAWPWALVVCLLAGANYAVIVARGLPCLYDMTFWMFVYVFFGLAPLVQLRTGDFPTTTPGLTAALNTHTFLVIVAGCVLWSLGRGLPRERSESLLRTPAHPHRTPVVALASAALAVGWFYVLSVGPGAFVRSRSELFAARQAAWPDPSTLSLVTGVAYGLLLVSLSALVILLRQGGRELRGLKAWSVAVGLTLVFAVNPVSSPRYLFGTVLLSILAMLGGFATTRRFRVSAVSVLIAMVLVFPYADHFRRAESGSLLNKGGPVQALSNGDYDSFAQVNNGLWYVETHGATLGRQAAGVVLFWVPRSVWPDKPLDTGVLLAQSRGYTFTNLSAPLWAELLVNGAWPAVLGGMYALGRGVRRWDAMARSRMAAAPLGAVLPFYMIILLRGSLLQATALLAALVGAAWCLRRFAAEREEAPREVATRLPVSSSVP
jgi:hypothetical protein